MSQPKMITEKRWAAIDRHGELHLADRGVPKSAWAYEMRKWDVQNAEDAPHKVVRVTLTYEAKP